jgi:branched-chain amino acid transport system substrate-binding protein
MSRTFRHVATLAVASALALGLAAPVQARAPLKIGVVLPLSGRNAAAGQSNLFGMRLVVDRVNAARGIKSLGGAKIKLVVADDASVPVSSAVAARRLIENERVVFILGPYSTPEAEAMVPVTERAGIGAISTQASYDGLFERHYKGFTTVSMTSSQFGTSYADFLLWLMKTHGAKIKTLAISYPDNDYGRTAAKSAQKGLVAAGVSIVGAFGFPPRTQDLTPIVLRLKQLNPDAVISIGYFQDGVLLHTARVAQSYAEQPIWVGGSSSFTDDRMWSTLGDKIARVALGGPRTFGLAQFDNGAPTPGVKWLNGVARKRKAGVVVDQAMAAGAQAAWILVDALEQSGATAPEKIAQAVKRVRIPATSERVTMPQFLKGITFEPSGKPKGPVALFVQWKDGTKKIVYPEALKTGNINLE